MAAISTPPPSARKSWLQIRRDLQRAERALDGGEAGEAEELFRGLAAARPACQRFWSQLARAASEAGHPEAAFEASQRVLQLAGSHDAGWILQAEVDIASGHHTRAAEALQRCSADNAVAPGLRAVLECLSRKAPATAGLALPPHSWWFGPVLAHLLYLLETLLEERLKSPADPAALHAARIGLFTPDLRPEVFPPPRRGIAAILGRCFSSKAGRARAAREEEVLRHLRGGELTASEEKLAVWLREDPGAFGADASDRLGDPRFALRLEILISQARWGEALEAGEPELRGEKDGGEPIFFLYLAYASLAGGRLDRARELLRQAQDRAGLTAEICNLRAILAAQEGKPEQAIPWFRRAAGRNDTAMVDVARKQMEVLLIPVTAPPAARP